MSSLSGPWNDNFVGKKVGGSSQRQGIIACEGTGKTQYGQI